MISKFVLLIIVIHFGEGSPSVTKIDYFDKDLCTKAVRELDKKYLAPASGRNKGFISAKCIRQNY